MGSSVLILPLFKILTKLFSYVRKEKMQFNVNFCGESRVHTSVDY